MNKSLNKEIYKEVTEHTRENRKEQEKLDQQKNYPMLHGTITDVWTDLYQVKSKKDNMSKMPFIKNEVITMKFMPPLTANEKENKRIEKTLKKLIDKRMIQPSTHKLFCRAIQGLTAVNDTGHGKKRHLNTTKVCIPIREYATACGYPVDADLRNFTRKIKKDMLILRCMSIDIKKKINGDPNVSWLNMGVVITAKTDRGYALVEFHPDLANALMTFPLTQYSQGLFRIDNRNPNAYAIGYKMCIHGNNANNIKRGGDRVLKVENLLKQTNLSIDGRGCKANGWESRVKDKLEDALELLVKNNVIDGWHYRSDKTDFRSIEEWENDYIEFELSNRCDHEARIARNSDKKKKAKTKS